MASSCLAVAHARREGVAPPVAVSLQHSIEIFFIHACPHGIGGVLDEVAAGTHTGFWQFLGVLSRLAKPESDRV